MKRSNATSQPVSRLVPVVALIMAVTLVFSGAVNAVPRSRFGEPLAAPLPNVSFEPNPLQLGVTEQGSVSVLVDNVEGLYAVELRIAFPDGLVQVVDADSGQPGTQIQPGDILDGLDTYAIQNTADNATGLIEYIISVTGSPTGKDGSGVIATIPLQGLAPGNAVMSFVEVVLAERDGTSIPYTLATNHVDIDITPLPATSTPTPSATATEAPVSATPSHTATAGPSLTPTRSATPTQTNTPGVAPQTEVQVVPLSQVVGMADTCIVQVQVRNAVDLYGYDVRLDYNGALLDVEDAEPGVAGIQAWNGDAFDGLAHQVFENWAYDDGLFGQVHFAATLDNSNPSGITGDAVLFWVVLVGISPGMSPVNLAEVELVNHSGGDIPRSLHHAEVQVTEGGGSSTPSVTSTPGLVPTNTATPLPTATGTLSSTPTVPTATPSSTGVLVTPTAVCADRIENGGFETLAVNEAPPWVRSGSVTYTTIEKHGGVRSAWLGGYNNASDSLHQDVSIPTHLTPGEETTQALFSYWWGVLTSDDPTSASDYMYVRVRDTSGALLETLETISDASIVGRWQQSQWDLTAYEGQTIRISFETTTDGALTSSFFVDDVQLVICEILLPTPTPTASSTATISPTPTQTGLPTATPTISPTPVEEVFQQVEGVYEGCIDSYLSQWEPKTNFGHQGALSIRTGGVKRPIIKFDLSSIPGGVTVLNASLELYTSHYKSHEQAMTVGVYGVKKAWREMETTWGVARTNAPWSLSGADDTGPAPAGDRDAVAAGSLTVSETNTWYAFDVTSLAQAWLNGSRPNEGILLRAEGNTVEMSFWSSEYSIRNLRPRLIVRYIHGALPTVTNTPLVPATPDGSTPTPTLTPQPSGPQLVLQEGVLGYAGTQDTHISEWQPTTNYGGNVTMIVRQGDVRSPLVRFDLSGLPSGATIQEATLSLYAVSRSNAGNLTVDLYNVKRSWAEGQATWQMARTGQPWAEPGCRQPVTDRAINPTSSQFVNAINTWFDWDITSLVQSWVANSANNRGMILKGAGSTSVEYSFATADYWWGPQYAPKLTIRYTN